MNAAVDEIRCIERLDNYLMMTKQTLLYSAHHLNPTKSN